MEKRVNVSETEPLAYKAMYALEGYLSKTQITKIHKDLIKIRASQINGCAFCIDLHTKDALKNGESNQRIFLLNAWRETDLFSEEEKVILAMTEEITLIHNRGLSDETYKRAERMFGKNYIAQVIMAIATINTWNRIAISTHLQPEIVNNKEYVL
ncbi:carboxymuconolactone decarboxylase family protein [Chryseosolibacter indicus]|uniref:Carboxymuconolactone decarboxylase family protein n=1 Tax=Chryseosolibacter indicus TaxID=2782351 RepID=A0ABS5VVM3_9BACT|nr:carboxymuconolactone decarboxylase family protein [Chryseosolibacter indicus]MBT1704924.1 carboxymuconolactone decarboxylase family protein [Chryseosolibacter indicus]